MSLLLIARIGGPGDFGRFALISSIGYLIAALLSFGTTTRVLRANAEKDPQRLTSALFRLRLTTAGVTVVIMLGIQLVLGLGEFGWLALAFVAGDTLVDFEQARLASVGRHLSASLIVVLQRLLPAVLLVALFVVHSDQVIVATSASVVLVVLAVVGPIRSNVPGIRMRSVVKSSLGYWANTLVANTNQLEPIVLRAVASASVVGGYAAASRIGNPLTIFASALQFVFVPHLVQLERAQARAVYKRLFIAVSAYGVLLIAVSPLIVRLVTLILGSAYANVSTIIYAVIVAAAFSAVSQVVQVRLIAEGHPWTPAVTIAIGSVIGLTILAVAGSQDPRLIWLDPIVTQSVILCSFLVIDRRASVANRNRENVEVET